MIGLLTFLAGLSLFVLPGAWLAFRFAPSNSSLRVRCALSVVLGPIVVVPQFYLLRWAGLSFEHAAYVIAVLNAPPLWLVAKSMRATRIPPLSAVLLWAAVLALPAIYLGRWQGDPVKRSSWGHTWTHTDIIYTLANGQLRPEETLLAGVRLAYPWLAHVYEGLVTFLLGGAPTSLFLAINIVWALAAIVFVAEIVATLGGGRVAQATSAAWLCFGVDAVGYAGRRLLPALAPYRIWGDARFNPWLRKFGIFEQTMIGITLFAAVLDRLSRSDDSDSGVGDASVLVFALLLSSALFYPVLFPASAALVGARLLIGAVRRARAGAPIVTRESFGLAAALAVATMTVAGYVFAVSLDRAGDPAMGLSEPSEVLRKSIAALIALSPLLAGLALARRTLWNTHADHVALLVLGALGSIVPFVAFNIFNFANEYKFMYTAAICLAPFPAVAVTTGYYRLGRSASVVAGALALALFASGMWTRTPVRVDGAPAIDPHAFVLTLRPNEPFAEAALAVRTLTPVESVIVSRALPFDLTAVTSRSLYVPYEPGELHGVGLGADYLLKTVRDYPPAIVDGRRAAVGHLFGASGDGERATWIRTIAGDVKRPVVVLTRAREDRSLVDWLARQPDVRALLSSGAVGVWLYQ